MFLSKNPNGKYYIIYQKPDGKRSSKSTRHTHKKDAERFLLKFQRELQEIAERKFIPINLKAFTFNFLRYSEHLYTSKTLEVYKATFNFLLKHFGDIPLSELTGPKIEDYIFKRLRESSIYAAQHDLSNLSCAFYKAIRDGYLLSNPCKSIKRFRLPEQLPMFCTKEDIKKLLAVIEDQDIKDLTLFAVNTGLRQEALDHADIKTTQIY
jgi:site-specific recombinase XerD